MRNILVKAVLLAAAFVLSLAPMVYAQTTYTSDTNLADFKVSSYGTFSNFTSGDVSSPFTPTSTEVAEGLRVYGGGSLSGLPANNNWILVTFVNPVSSILVFPNIDHYGSAYDGYQYQIWGSNDQVCWTPLFDALTVNGTVEPFTLGTFVGTPPSTVNNVLTPGAGPNGIVGYEAQFNFATAYRYYAFGASTVAFAQGNPDQEFSAVGAVSPAPFAAVPAAAADGNVVSCDANFTPTTLSSGLSGPSGLVYRHPTNDLVVAQNGSSQVSTVGASSGSVGPFTGTPPSAPPFDVAIRASDGLVAVLNEALGQITFYNSAGSQQGQKPVSISSVSAYSCGAGLAFDTGGNLYVGAGPANAVVPQAAASASPGNCLTTGWAVLELSGQSPWSDSSASVVTSGLNQLGGLAFSAAPPPLGALYAVSSSAGSVYQVLLGGDPTTIVTVPAAVDPRGIALDPLTGDIFISQFNGTAVFRVPAGTTLVTTFATGFSNTVGLAFDVNGNLYVCDYNADIIYKFSRASNATPIVPLTSGSPNTFTFTDPNPAMPDVYQKITIPASANLNGAVSLQEIFVSVSPATLNATLSNGSKGDLIRFGGSPVPAGTTCWPVPSANNNCVVTIQVCYDVNGNPYAICPVQQPAGSPDLILLSSHWNGTLPPNPGLVIDYDSDPSGQAATSIGSSSSSDPTVSGGSRGLCSKTYPVNLAASNSEDFSISISPSPIQLLLNGSSSAKVTVNSINSFNSQVNLAVSTAPVGVTATTSSLFVIPTGNTSLNVSVQPYVMPTPTSAPIPLFVSGTAAGVTHSANVNVTVTATPAGIQSVIQAFQSNGCITSGMSGAMEGELSSGQAAVAGGDFQTGVNTFGAFDDQDEDDGGRHISRSCTIGGYTFNPVQVLHIDIRSLINSYKTNSAPNPVFGYVLNSNNVGVPQAVVCIFNSSGQRVACRQTDITGFYFFGKTSLLQSKSTYTVKIIDIPEQYSQAIPSTQSFQWNNAQTQLMNFLLK